MITKSKNHYPEKSNIVYRLKKKSVKYVGMSISKSSPDGISNDLSTKIVKATKVFHAWLIMGTDENGPMKSSLHFCWSDSEEKRSNMFWCLQIYGVSVVTRVFDRLAMKTATMSKWYSIVMKENHQKQIMWW